MIDLDKLIVNLKKLKAKIGLKDKDIKRINILVVRLYRNKLINNEEYGQLYITKGFRFEFNQSNYDYFRPITYYGSGIAFTTGTYGNSIDVGNFVNTSTTGVNR